MRVMFVSVGMLLAIGASAQSLVPLETKADWDAQYAIGAEGAWGHPNTRPEVTLNYHRFVILPLARTHAAGLSGALGLVNGSRVVVVKSGFGWILEALAERGVSAVGTDLSSYIQAAKAANEDADLLIL